jgi:hypothetical protein
MGIICQHGQKEGMHNENLKRLNCCMFKGFRVMVFNTTFNNISVLLVEETGVPGENHRSVASH